MRRTIVALVAGSALLAGCRDGTGEDAPAPSSGCPAVEIVGLRGQGQSLDANDGLGTEVRLIADELADELSSLGSVRTTAIRHASRLGSWDQYVADVEDGRSRLRARIRSIIEDCPDTRIAVVGFSQGSQIAREELAARPALARHVDVLVLVGSPLRDPGGRFMPVMLPGGIPSGGGRLGPGPELGPLGTRTVEACRTGDPVCAGGSDDSVHRHAYEDPDVVRAIAGAAASFLTR